MASLDSLPPHTHCSGALWGFYYFSIGDSFHAALLFLFSFLSVVLQGTSLVFYEAMNKVAETASNANSGVNDLGVGIHQMADTFKKIEAKRTDMVGPAIFSSPIFGS